MVLLLYQCISWWMMLDIGWTSACYFINSCPSVSSDEFWAQLEEIVMKTPYYVLMLAIILLVISVILTFYNWIVLYWSTYNYIDNHRIFHRDVGVTLWIIWIISCIGFFAIPFSIPLWFGDNVHLDRTFIAWVRTTWLWLV